MKLQENLQAFQEQEAEIWVISPDPADKLEAMRAKQGLTFPTLMDPDLAVIRRYGILNEESPNLPHPTALVIDKEGKITYVRVDEKYSERPEPEELLDALRGAEEAAAKAITPEFLRSTIAALADDAMEGRGPGTAGDAMARKYLIEQLQGLGLEPGAADGSWEQSFPIVGVNAKAPAHWTFTHGDQHLDLTS